MGDIHPDVDEPFVPTIIVERSSPVPLYHQIAAPLEELITSGTLQPGQLIEDEVSMAHRLNVSRPTARRALQDLVSRGLLSRRRGVGTRVTPSHVRRPLALTSLNEDLVKSGFNPHTEVLAYEVRLADAHDATLIGREEGTEVVHVRRRRWIDDRPLAILTNLIPGDIAPTLTQLSAQGLYACLEDRGIHLASARQAVGARSADAEAADLLSIDEGGALLTMERTAYDMPGQVVEYGTHVYNAELYSFQFTLVAE
jgi:transcriptional regulator, GntR family